jgi:glycosyltransferase involved in cell wall biosynthesis
MVSISAAASAEATRPRVLYLTHHAPWPAFSGGTVRESRLLEALAWDYAIDVIGVGSSVGADAAVVARRLGVRGAELFIDESRRTTRRQRHSSSARKRLRAEAGDHGSKPDVVHVEGGYLFHLVPAELHDRTCVIEHNVESAVLRQFARIDNDPRLHRAAWRVAELEERAWTAAAMVAVITDEDRDIVEERVGRSDVRVVPHGCDHLAVGALSKRQTFASPTAVFLANYAYAPNRDALYWLLDAVWPRVVESCPDARLVLAGVGLTPNDRGAASGRPGVEVRGFIEDVAAVLDESDVLLCPLRAGGGVKVKVLEAMRRGCSVVTTSVGAQGIHGVAREALCIADTAAGLAHEVIEILGCPETRPERHRRTLRAVHALPTWEDASIALAACWSEIYARHR